MKLTTLLGPSLLLIAATIGQIHSKLSEDSMDMHIRPDVNVEDPSSPFSSKILKSHMNFNYRTNVNQTVILQAEGFVIFAAVRLLDLRPKNKDSVTLFIPGENKKQTFSNPLSGPNRIEDKNETKQTFISHTGKLGVNFQTGDGDGNSFLPKPFGEDVKGYEGFQIVYTVQAVGPCDDRNYFPCKNGNCINKRLKCDTHNHCGDRSDQMNCDKIDIDIPGVTVDIGGGKIIIPEVEIPKSVKNTVGTIVGIVCGVFFGLLILGGVIAFIIFRRAAARSRTQGAVVNRSY